MGRRDQIDDKCVEPDEIRVHSRFNKWEGRVMPASREAPAVRIEGADSSESTRI